jgi:hypothetical protein
MFGSGYENCPEFDEPLGLNTKMEWQHKTGRHHRFKVPKHKSKDTPNPSLTIFNKF